MALTTEAAVQFSRQLSGALRDWEDFNGISVIAAAQGGQHATLVLKVQEAAGIQAFNELPADIQMRIQMAHQIQFGSRLNEHDLTITPTTRAQGLIK